jgi:hypothetical protein
MMKTPTNAKSINGLLINLGKRSATGMPGSPKARKAKEEGL